MIVADLSDQALAHALGGPGLRLRTGPVVSAVRSKIGSVASGIRLHYAQHALVEPDAFADFHIEIHAGRGVRRLIRPQAWFRFEGSVSFHPLPFDQAFPMFEWGLNWCISSYCHQFVIIHAGVVARDGRAVVFPAPPGSGKSTLCAALMLRGWRLLSDELALIDPATHTITPIPRPIGLKNASIDVVRTFSCDAIIGPAIDETAKGTVAHLKPLLASVVSGAELATPAFIVFPAYRPGAPMKMTPVGKADAFMRLVDNAFNYDIHGRRAFETLANVVDACRCLEFSYASLDEAITAFDAMFRDR
ncbi:MAG TPA: HprK-related kinase A [Casimicrobiaceae bacterium]|nr:HprK-related kinase A [Casimicrobiaceae bacterium]